MFEFLQELNNFIETNLRVPSFLNTAPNEDSKQKCYVLRQVGNTENELNLCGNQTGECFIDVLMFDNNENNLVAQNEEFDKIKDYMNNYYSSKVPAVFLTQEIPAGVSPETGNNVYKMQFKVLTNG